MSDQSPIFCLSPETSVLLPATDVEASLAPFFSVNVCL
jgi:hypothetical protein